MIKSIEHAILGQSFIYVNNIIQAVEHLLGFIKDIYMPLIWGSVQPIRFLNMYDSMLQVQPKSEIRN
jgi:hypothetical protein